LAILIILVPGIFLLCVEFLIKPGLTAFDTGGFIFTNPENRGHGSLQTEKTSMPVPG